MPIPSSMLAGLRQMLAALLAPVRRPQPTRRCPTFADVSLERAMKTTILQEVPIPLRAEVEPEIVTVNLAALRRVRLDLIGPSLAWLWLAGAVGLSAGCTGTALERSYQARLIPMPATDRNPAGADYLFSVDLNLLNGDNPATAAMIQRYLDHTMAAQAGCSVGRGMSPGAAPSRSRTSSAPTYAGPRC